MRTPFCRTPGVTAVVTFSTRRAVVVFELKSRLFMPCDWLPLHVTTPLTVGQGSGDACALRIGA